MRRSAHWLLPALILAALTLALRLPLRSSKATAMVVVATPSPKIDIPASRELGAEKGPASVPVVPRATPAPPEPAPRNVIAYAMNGDLMVADVMEGKFVPLSARPGPERDPAFSPDGRSLLFSAQWDGNWELYRMNLADEGITRLTFDPGYDGRPAWSPDGRTIAFEAVRGGSLDIYLMSVEGGAPSPLLISAAAEAAPAWSPDGRWLAYSAYEGGQRDLFLFPLAGGGPINLTHSPGQNEDEPAFSPDGGQLAYTVGQGGVRDLTVAPIDLGAGRLAVEAARVVARGSLPTWSPDGAHLAYGVDSHGWPHAQLMNLADGATQTYPGSCRVGRITWGNARLPDALMARALTAPPSRLAELYAEEIGPPPDNGAPYRLVRMPVEAPGPFLSDRVDGAFNALRSRVIAETGRDYLNIFGDMWRVMGARPRPGQNPRSWHKTGRAFDVNQGLLNRDAVVVFETMDGGIFFHLYFRTERQDGTQGEPLHTPPWVFDRTGGGPMDVIPAGYWMDFTAAAAEYGWRPIEALSRWRTYAADREWWHYEKRDGLSWFEAMTEVYPREQVIAVFGAGQ